MGRLSGRGFAPPLLVCGREHAAAMRAEGGCEALIEPMARGTGAAVLAAACKVGKGLVLVSPADHCIARPEVLRRAIDQARASAEAGHIVLFGIVPDRPASEFGWIRLGEAEEAGVHAVQRFVEKPGAGEAAALLRAGDHVWNAGLFLFDAEALVRLASSLQPDLLDAVQRALGSSETEPGAVTLGQHAFLQAPQGSFDTLILEQAEGIRVVPVDMGWDDLGSWDAVKRAAQGRSLGPVVTRDLEGCLVWSDGPPVVAAGLRDAVVVAGAEGVVVLGRGHAQQVGLLADEVRALSETRPWGRFAVVDRGEGYQVKRLVVDAGQRTSLQRHVHRVEQWTVVSGHGVAHVGGVEHVLHGGDTVRVPAGAEHRLTNRANEPLVIVEVQTGAYLGEDDIERVEDDYGRAPHEGLG